jgi:ADP-heptose:LPS heptosyltransferase
MNNTTIFHIEGGIGKNIVASSVIRSYKKQNPDKSIIVSTAWPDIFQNNPNVDRTYYIGNTPYFYKDFVYQKNVEVFAHDPYRTTSHVTKQKSLVETWCEMIGTEYDQELPDLYFNFREIEIASQMLTSNNKPILLFQPFGGPQQQAYPYSWTRDIHPSIAQNIVNSLIDKYNVVHVCYEHHPVLNNATRFDKQINKKVLMAMLKFSQERIFIDSSLQHAAAAMRLPSRVVWVATDPKMFGYSIHNNIVPKRVYPEGHIGSYLFDYDFTGAIQECPYTDFKDIFDTTKILEKL